MERIYYANINVFWPWGHHAQRWMSTSRNLLTIRVRTGLQYPLHVGKGDNMYIGIVLRTRPQKTEVLCTNGCDMMKIPYCSKTVGVNDGTKLSNRSPAMVTWNILEWEFNNKQAKTRHAHSGIFFYEGTSVFFMCTHLVWYTIIGCGSYQRFR